jgi:hypothetical protein
LSKSITFINIRLVILIPFMAGYKSRDISVDD